jgi:hypothetical protein
VKKLNFINLKSATLGFWIFFGCFVQAGGILGLTEVSVAQKIGSPSYIYRDMNNQITAFVYCVGGLYKPDVFEQGQGWVEQTQPEPLSAFTGGPCTDKKRPISLYARFESGKLASVGYTTPHGNTYDRGWLKFIDNLISGLDAYTNKFTRQKSYSWGNFQALSLLNFLDGSSIFTFGHEKDSSLVGFAWYWSGAKIRFSKDPIFDQIMRYYIR